MYVVGAREVVSSLKAVSQVQKVALSWVKPSRDKRAEGTALWEPARTEVFVGPEHRHFVLGSARLASCLQIYFC